MPVADGRQLSSIHPLSADSSCLVTCHRAFYKKTGAYSNELQAPQGFNLNLNEGTLTMNSMKKRFALATVVCLFTATAFATQPGNNGGGNGGCGTNQQTNGCGGQGGAGGNGGNGGAGGNGTGVGVGLGVGIGYSNSESKSSSSSVSGSYSSGGNATGGAGGTANSSNSNAVSGYGGSSYGQGSGNTTSLTFEGSTFREAAQAAIASTPPATPKSCRIWISLAGSDVKATGSGILPLWKDGECLAVTKVQVMAETNAAARAMGAPAPFKVDSLLAGACQVDGMKEEIPACK